MQHLDPAAPSRFVVGIDLGTTNCAVCFVDTQSDPETIRTFVIPQFVASGLTESRETLPSFLYQPGEGELTEQTPLFAKSKTTSKSKTKKGEKPAASQNENDRSFVGVFARDHGADVPGRLITSAKSWLSHSGVDRTAPILPWGETEAIEKFSPVQVSARYLEHLRNAWDEAFPQHPLARQDVIVTLPASFDEVARELTVAAAKSAGLRKIVLLEEPQAAFYAFLAAQEKVGSGKWEVRSGDREEAEKKALSLSPHSRSSAPTPTPTSHFPLSTSHSSAPASHSPKILICDIGGGTTDLTLIRVRDGEDGKLRFHRVAVGEHLILGGDNLDLALAHHVQKRLGAEDRLPKNAETDDGRRLPLRTWAVLVRLCCQIKELMLGKNAPEKTTLHLPGIGSKLIGGSLQIEISRDEVRELLLEGFFPPVPLNTQPSRHQSGFREFGLPFAADPAVTKHLARFLTAHRHSGDEPGEVFPEGIDPARPDFVLFNGGVFAAEALQERILDVLSDWFRTSPADFWKPTVLANPRLDLSVARGAAHYGMVRRGAGERISAALARTYYLGVENPAKNTVDAICLLPANAEPDRQIVLEEPLFELLIGTPVSFPLFVSSLRLTDAPGESIEIEPEQLTALPPIRTVLKTRRKNKEMIRVRLGGRLTEIGTLELFAEEIPDKPAAKNALSWKLEFDVRSTTQTEFEAEESKGHRDGFFDESTWDELETCLVRTFTDHPDPIRPAELVKKLVEKAPLDRDDWPTSLLRRIGETLMRLEAGRKFSPEHEARWLNLLGYAYRPGFGYAVDDWRIDQFWKTMQGSLFHKSPTVRIQWWVLLRRIAGGLTPGQQQSFCEPILGNIRGLHKQLIEGRGRGSDLDLTSQEGAEIWRMLGSLELLPVETKLELGRLVLDLATKKRMEPVYEPMIWALGRLGARVLLSGPLNAIVPSETAAGWISRVIKDGKDRQADHFTIMELGRKTDDPYRDVAEDVRKKALAYLRRSGAPRHFLTLLEHASQWDEKEQELVFGESLPLGLRIAT